MVYSISCELIDPVVERIQMNGFVECYDNFLRVHEYEYFFRKSIFLACSLLLFFQSFSFFVFYLLQAFYVGMLLE